MSKQTAFDIVAPDGRRATVTPRSDADTLADLLAALGHAGVAQAQVDGQPIVAARRLVDVPGMRAGAHVGPAPPALDDGDEAAAVVEVTVIAGPSCQRRTALVPGRHTVGRSEHATVRLDDDVAELHHGVLDVDAAGHVRFTQLTGRVPVRLDGRPCAAGAPITVGAALEVGASLLDVRPLGIDPPAAATPSDRLPASGSVVAGADPWRWVVRRGPPGDDDVAPPELCAPDLPPDHPLPPATGLIGAAVAVAGALVVASVMGHMVFALFALIGAVASLATWLVGVVGAARRQQIAARDHRRRTDEFRAAVEAAIVAGGERHRQRAPTIVDALDELERFGGRIWERRLDADRPVELTAGLAATSFLPAIDGWERLPPDVAAELEAAARVDLQPATIRLAPGDGLALHGERGPATAVARSLVLQLATWAGPADWQLLVVTRHPDRWAWAAWLPHALRPDGTHGVVVPADVESAGSRLPPDRLTVVVTDDRSVFDARTGPLRRLVAGRRAIVMCTVERADSVPSVCDRVLRIGSSGRAEWTGAATAGGGPTRLHVAGIGADTATTMARRLAALVDPEDAAASAAAVPQAVRFADVDNAVRPGDGDDPVDRIADRWRNGGADPAPCAPIGVSADGLIDVDLVRDGPHGLIAGTTGAGKSELLRTLVLSLATRCSPDHLTFVLVDYKGGSTFDACERLPHTVGLVTDLDEGGAARALVSLEAELRRRERLLRDVGAADLTDYRRHPGVRPLPRLAVVVDEFAALVQELPDFVPSLVGVAQRGRSLGVHLLLATQRPTGVVSDDIRANTNLRLALRLHDPADARDVVGDDLPATFPRGRAGRAAVRLGPGELVVFQAAHCTGPVVRPATRLSVSFGGPDPKPGGGDDASELSTMVDAIVAVAEHLAIDRPHRPWLDPLPDVLDRCEVDALAAGECGGGVHDAVGVVDDPERQSRQVLRWSPAAGNLALVGPLGAGVTSALVALAAAQCRTSSPDELHVYVIDAAGDPLLDGLASVAHCGAVVRGREVERLHRLLVRLDRAIDDRHAGVDLEVRTVLLVDGYESLRSALSVIERAETLTLLDRVLADGPAAGVSCAVGGSEVNRVECAERWVFGPSGAGPPGRVTIASSGLVGQLAHGAAGLAELPSRSDGGGPAGIATLAERIDRTTLAASWSSGAPDGSGHVAHLVVGRAAADLEEVALVVPAGDHVFVGGPSRSGKSTALCLLAGSWRELNPGGRVVRVDRRRPMEPDALGPGAALVVVDDADRIDDDAVAALVGDHRPGVTLLVAARTEAVRAAYGHWTRDVVRSRCGVVLTSAGEVDGELLGAELPRRTLIAPRPGLAWVVDPAGPRLTQLALPPKPPKFPRDVAVSARSREQNGGGGGTETGGGQPTGSSPRR